MLIMKANLDTYSQMIMTTTNCFQLTFLPQENNNDGKYVGKNMAIFNKGSNNRRCR